MPTTSVSGSEPQTIYRGRNAVVRNLGIIPYVEVFQGNKDLQQSYALGDHTLTGTASFTAGSTTVTGAGTSFLDDVVPGMFLLIGDEVFVVNTVESNIIFIADRAPTTTAAGQTIYGLLRLFELDRKRGVLRRGSAIVRERKDITFVGRGKFYIDGADTGFVATSTPKRLQRAPNGTYTEFPLGFPDAPPAPVFDMHSGGWKGMFGGKYSFMASWWNSQTKGFSNPSPRVKENSLSVQLEIGLSGRFSVDVTNLLSIKPANADGVRIWGTLSGGGVSGVNLENFQTGALLLVKDMPFAGKTITAIDTGDDSLTIPDHDFKPGDFVHYIRTGGTTDAAPLVSNTGYWVFVKDRNTVRLASSVANFKANTVVNLTGAGDGTQTLGFFNTSDQAFFEYLDYEMGIVATGDNDQPPECEWVADYANRPFYISCFGNRKTAGGLGSAPGNFVVPGKDSNPEAAPFRWRVSVEDPITGWAKGLGRLFCQTPTGVWFVTPTGRTELARFTATPLDSPFTSRPLWTKGAISPYNITVVQADVYSVSGGQPYRSPSLADDRQSPFEIGKFVRDLMRNMTDGYLLVVSDPKNTQLCIIMSAVRKNGSGYWESEILPLDLSTNPGSWQPKIVLSSTTGDMIVSGAAIVNNRLEFLAGGRQSVGSPVMRTYRYDERAGSGSIPWSIAFQPSDMNEEAKAKFIRSFRATGRLTDPVVQVHGTTWANRTLNPDDIELGLNSISGNIPLQASGGIARNFEVRHMVKNLGLASIRLAGTWVDTGTNLPDRLDELVVEVGTHGTGQ